MSLPFPQKIARWFCGISFGGVIAFLLAVLSWLTARRGVIDPVCGMKVDRAKAVIKQVGGETVYFCSNHCLHAFEANPDTYLAGSTTAPSGPT